MKGKNIVCLLGDLTVLVSAYVCYYSNWALPIFFKIFFWETILLKGLTIILFDSSLHPRSNCDACYDNQCRSHIQRRSAPEVTSIDKEKDNFPTQIYNNIKESLILLSSVESLVPSYFSF